MKKVEAAFFPRCTNKVLDEDFKVIVRAIDPTFVIRKGVRLYGGYELLISSGRMVKRSGLKEGLFVAVMKKLSDSCDFDSFFLVYSNGSIFKSKKKYFLAIVTKDGETMLGDMEFANEPKNREGYTVDLSSSSCVRHIPFIMLSMYGAKYPFIADIRKLGMPDKV